MMEVGRSYGDSMNMGAVEPLLDSLGGQTRIRRLV